MLGFAANINGTHWLVLALLILISVGICLYVNLKHKYLKRLRIASAGLALALLLSINVPFISAALSTPIFAWHQFEPEASLANQSVLEFCINAITQLIRYFL